ncbi:hypothetical protein [Roseibium album]|uniref:hypothetical protein n=1 Tax=Roseibium album TaxID=311410 RepID=UPI00391D1791
MSENNSTEELAREKFEFDKELRRKEFELREAETTKRGLSAPQAALGGSILALLSAIGGALVSGNIDLAKTRESGRSNQGVEEIKNQGTIDVEKFRLQKDLVLKAIAKEDAAEVRKTLLFFAESGLLNEFKSDLLAYLSKTQDKDLPTGTKLGTLDLVVYQQKVRRFRPLLDVIGGAETGGNYNAFYASANNISEPNIVNMTLSEVRRWQNERVDSGSPSSATGRYLFLRKTLDRLSAEVGLSGNEAFDSLTQDVLAVRLLERRGLEQFLSDELTEEQFILNLAKEWASIPVPFDLRRGERTVRKGQSYYTGDGLNKAGVKLEAVLFAVRSIKSSNPN